MNDDARVRQEIVEHEAWLSSRLLADESTSIEHLKLKIHVALGEQWLAGNMAEADESVSKHLLNQVCAGVAQSLRVKPEVGEPRKLRRWPWVAGAGSGLAAMLFLSFTIFQNGSGESELLAAFDEDVLQQESEEVDDEILDLDELLAELSEQMAYGDEPEWPDDGDFDEPSAE